MLSSIRKVWRLLNVLKACEKHRVQFEKEERKAEKDRIRKERAEWVPEWILKKEEEQKKEEEKVKEKDPFVLRIMKPVFGNAGGQILLALILLAVGIALGIYLKESEMDRLIWKLLFLTASLIILLYLFYQARRFLYKEENLPYLMTLPLTQTELLMAKYLQLLGSAYRVMMVVMIPLWLGYVAVVQGDWFISVAVWIGILVIPQFVLLLLYSGLILGHLCLRYLTTSRRRILFALLAGIFLSLLLIVLQMITNQKFLRLLGEFLLNLMVFNLPLGWIMQSQNLSSLILNIVVLVMMVGISWLLFLLFCPILYRRSSLQRWDLADDTMPPSEQFHRIVRQHSPRLALFIREMRSIKGIKAYWSTRIQGILISLILPLLLAIAEVLFTAIVGSRESTETLRIVTVIIGNALPMAVIQSWMNMPAATTYSRDQSSMNLFMRMPIAWPKKKSMRNLAERVKTRFSRVQFIWNFLRQMGIAWSEEQSTRNPFKRIRTAWSQARASGNKPVRRQITWRDFLHAKICAGICCCILEAVPSLLLFSWLLVHENRISLSGLFPVLLFYVLILIAITELRCFEDFFRPVEGWKSFKELVTKKKTASGKSLFIVLLTVPILFLAGILIEWQMESELTALKTLLGLIIAAVVLHILLHKILFRMVLKEMKRIGCEEEVPGKLERLGRVFQKTAAVVKAGVEKIKGFRGDRDDLD